MAKKKGAHLSDKAQYAGYKAQGRYTRNKRLALERHLKKNPTDEQAQKALANVSEATIRKTPNSYVWGKKQRRYAEQLASLGYSGHIALGGREEAIRKDQVIGFGAQQILDMSEKDRNRELGRDVKPDAAKRGNKRQKQRKAA